MTATGRRWKSSRIPRARPRSASALRAVESARQAAETGGIRERAAHVGHHLIGKGRRDLETDVAYRPRAGQRVRRIVFAHATSAYLGSITILTILLAGLGVGLRPTLRRLAVGGAGGGAPPPPARQRPGRRVRAEAGGEAGSPTAAPPPRVRGEHSRRRAHDGDRAHAALQRGRGPGARRAHRGARPRQPRPAHPFRDPRRLHGRARARHAGGRGAAGHGPGRHRGPERPPVRRPGRPLLPVPSETAVEPARRVLDGVGEEARQDRGVQPAPARGHGHELRRAARRARDPALRPLLHHAGLGHAPPARGGPEAHRHHRPPLEPSALRRGGGPGHGGLRHPPAARQRHHGQRRRFAVRAHLCRPYRRRSLHHRRLRHLPGPVRGGDLHGQGSLRRGRLQTRPWTAACPRTRSCPTTCSKACTRAPPSSPTSRSWTTIPPACSPTRGASAAGCAATGRS